MRLRILVVIALAFVALGVLADPYTHNLSGSDVFLPAPIWQTAAALTDITLILTAAAVALSARYSLALRILAIEFIFALGYNLALIHRDGINRFIWGFGGHRHMVAFVIAFALRLLVLLAVLQALKQIGRRAA